MPSKTFKKVALCFLISKNNFSLSSAGIPAMALASGTCTFANGASFGYFPRQERKGPLQEMNAALENPSIWKQGAARNTWRGSSSITCRV